MYCVNVLYYKTGTELKKREKIATLEVSVYVFFNHV